MISLNALNGAETHTLEVARKLLYRNDDPLAEDPLCGVEMGVAFGGGVEALGKLWKGRGVVWGFDTFTGHPQEEIALKDPAAEGGLDSIAARCMDQWYLSADKAFAKENTTFGLIRSQLNEQGLYNVVLVPGLITPETDVSFLPPLHYALLDLDYVLSMRTAYGLIENRIVPGGYLCLHDVLPVVHIPGLNAFYREILASGKWDVVVEEPNCYLAILQRR